MPCYKKICVQVFLVFPHNLWNYLESNDIFYLPLMQAFSLQGGPALLPIREQQLLREAAEVN